jgi:hypothetical protein
MTPTFSISDALSANNLESHEYDAFLAHVDATRGEYPSEFQPYVSQVNPYVMGFLHGLVTDPGSYPIMVATYIQAGQILALNPAFSVADAFNGIQAIARDAADVMDVTGDDTEEGKVIVDHAHWILAHASQSFREKSSAPLTNIAMAVVLNQKDEAMSGGAQFIASMLYAGWWMQSNRPPFAVTLN